MCEGENSMLSFSSIEHVRPGHAGQAFVCRAFRVLKSRRHIKSQRDFNQSAQGCEERATLGPGVAEFNQTLKELHQPITIRLNPTLSELNYGRPPRPRVARSPLPWVPKS